MKMVSGINPVPFKARNRIDYFAQINIILNVILLHRRLTANEVLAITELDDTKCQSTPVVIILATESEVRGFKPGRGQWIFSERKNPEYDFLRKGSKAVGPCHTFTAHKTNSSRF